MNEPLIIPPGKTLRDLFTGMRFMRIISRSISGFVTRVTPRLARPVLMITLLLIGLKTLAPVSSTMTIIDSVPVNPFRELMYAVGMVETMGNSFAYNEYEEAVGIFQIRQVRIDDYNRRTGSSLLLEDMFDSGASEKVFLYFASLLGPYQMEKIARAWNGSGPMTDFYWSRVKTYLER